MFHQRMVCARSSLAFRQLTASLFLLAMAGCVSSTLTGTMANPTPHDNSIKPAVAGKARMPDVNDIVPTVLIVGLDGVAFSTFQKMQDGPHFRNFSRVSPMVSTFPSISDPDWTQLMGLHPQRGFTKAYFDPTVHTPKGQGEEEGSLMSHLTIEPEYERIMDFKLHGPWEHLSMILWTETTARYELQNLQTAFFASRGKKVFKSLIINTDIISHTEGEQAVMRFLGVLETSLNQILDEYHKMYGTSLDIILVSDHGNSFYSPQDIPWEDSMAKQGWTHVPHLRRPKDVAFFVPEILGFGAFYCLQPSSRDLAKSLARVPHILQTMYEEDDGYIHVLAWDEKIKDYDEARLNYWPKKDKLIYEIVKGSDPLLGSPSQYFIKGKSSAKDYFMASLDDIYPNAVERIWEGFHSDSQLVPSVLANAEYGYVFGNKALRLLTGIRGFSSSHGSLHRQDSLGILTSTREPLSAIKPSEFPAIVEKAAALP